MFSVTSRWSLPVQTSSDSHRNDLRGDKEKLQIFILLNDSLQTENRKHAYGRLRNRSVIYHRESLQQTPEGWRWKTPGGDRKSERKKQTFVLNVTLNNNMQREASMFVFSLIDSLIVSIDYVSVQSIRYFTSFKGNCKVLCWFMNRTFPFPPHLKPHIKSI